MNSVAPSRAYRSAMARPMPRPPPVTTATRPESCPTRRPYTPRHGVGFLDRPRVRGAARVDAHLRRRGDRAALALLRRHERRRVVARDRAAQAAGEGPRPVGVPPRPRARRTGLRTGEARVDARDPRPLPGRAEHLRQP